MIQESGINKLLNDIFASTLSFLVWKKPSTELLNTDTTSKVNLHDIPPFIFRITVATIYKVTFELHSTPHIGKQFIKISNVANNSSTIHSMAFQTAGRAPEITRHDFITVS